MADQEFRTIHQIVHAARLKLNQTDWDYLIGGTETETTLKRNRQALDSLALMPRVLNDVSEIDTNVEFMGHQLKIPVLLAPIGSLQVFEAGGGASAAKAAGDFGVMSIASSVCKPSIEDIAAASDAPKIYQLYVRGDDNWVDGIIERVINSGYTGFCLTVDTAMVSRRERDIAKGVRPTSQSLLDGEFVWQSRLNWKDVERIRKKWDIPLILKGINVVDDAKRALDLGVDVIYVSNHGGRQLDHGRGAIDLLPDIVNAIQGQARVVVDGGFYRGTDIIKAMAMGADAVGLGRLEAWAMAAGGAPAVVNMLKILRHEIMLSMGLCGVSRFSELNPSYVSRVQAVADASVTSAFPLLDLNDGY